MSSWNRFKTHRKKQESSKRFSKWGWSYLRSKKTSALSQRSSTCRFKPCKRKRGLTAAWTHPASHIAIFSTVFLSDTLALHNSLEKSQRCSVVTWRLVQDGQAKRTRFVSKKKCRLDQVSTNKPWTSKSHIPTNEATKMCAVTHLKSATFPTSLAVVSSATSSPTSHRTCSEPCSLKGQTSNRGSVHSAEARSSARLSSRLTFLTTLASTSRSAA